MNENQPTQTTITDIDIPFGRLVAILLKLMLASIPAVIIFYIVAFVLALLAMAVFGGGAAVLNNALSH